VAAFVVWVACKGLKIDGLRKTALWILITVLLQFMTGAATIFLSWPLALAVAHNGGAALLVLLLTVLNFKMRIVSEAAPTRAATRLSSA
jgi:cytochrome c oxidase assembly protein subunit 15